jgi:excinuclease ABC subunit A
VLKIVGASGNNLKKVTVEFPVGLLTCVTGVSGSGKSTLVNDTLYTAVARQLYRAHDEPRLTRRSTASSISTR